MLGSWGHQQSWVTLISLIWGFHPPTGCSGLGTQPLLLWQGVPASNHGGAGLLARSPSPVLQPCLQACLWLHLLFLAALPGWTLELVHHLTSSGSATGRCYQHPALPAVLTHCRAASWSTLPGLWLLLPPGSLSPPKAALLLPLPTSLVRSGGRKAHCTIYRQKIIYVTLIKERFKQLNFCITHLPHNRTCKYLFIKQNTKTGTDNAVLLHN